MLLTDIDLENVDNFIRGGQIVGFPNDFEVYSEGGVLHFGSVAIDTDPEWEEEEDEDSEWYDEE